MCIMGIWRRGQREGCGQIKQEERVTDVREARGVMSLMKTAAERRIWMGLCLSPDAGRPEPRLQNKSVCCAEMKHFGKQMMS